MRLLITVFTAVLVLWSSPLAASELPPLLERAVAKIEASKDPSVRLAYSATTDMQGAPYTARFDPASDAENGWSLVSPAEDSNDERLGELLEGLSRETDTDEAVIVDDMRKFFDSGAEFLREDETYAYFGFKPSAELGIGNGTQSVDVAKYLEAEAAVHKPTETLRSLRLYASKSFKPHIMAKVNAFEMTTVFGALSEDGGPDAFVMESMDIYVKGSAAFKGFEQRQSVKFHDFERRSGLADRPIETQD